MKHVIGAVVPRPSRHPLVVLPGVTVAGLLLLSACASPGGSAAPSLLLDPSATATVSPTASPTPTAETSPEASPESTPATDEPFNGQILIVTSEIRDGRLEVTAMVPEVAESGGVCTLTVASTGASTTTEASEGKDVTYCGVMAIDAAGPAEDLSFTVSYASSTTRAASALTTVEPAE